MKMKNLAAHIGISGPYLSKIIHGFNNKTASWKLSQKIGSFTISDPRIWANGESDKISQAIERINYISDKLGMDDKTLLTFFSDRKSLAESDIHRISERLKIDTRIWYQADDDLVQAIDKARQTENEQCHSERPV